MGLLSRKLTLNDFVAYAGADLSKKHVTEEHMMKTILDMDFGAVEMLMKAALNEIGDVYARWFINEATEASKNNVARVMFLSSVNRSLAQASASKLPKDFHDMSTFQMLYSVYVELLKSTDLKPLCSLED